MRVIPLEWDAYRHDHRSGWAGERTETRETGDMGPTERPRVLSGMQPTADSLHLGNYLGELRQWVTLQQTHDVFYFVADMHSLTVVDTDPEVRRRRTR
jgi:tryptophanyl-tRNA synthetase